MTDKRAHKLQKQCYFGGETVGCRVVIKWLKFAPASFDGQHGKMQNYYLTKCVNCGTEKIFEQHMLRRNSEVVSCRGCPPEIREKLWHKNKPRKNKPKKEGYRRPDHTYRDVEGRYIGQDALWFLWVMLLMPTTSLYHRKPFDSEMAKVFGYRTI